ncbi:hypothetical protein [Dyella sp.]|jgi:hypothetical protein|uniref:hypothetical protein n=1 Tax=Dyella sp. TaxID=1869338 RepID=UPI002FDB1D15
MALEEPEDKEVEILTFGTLVGGSGTNSHRWKDAVWDLSWRIDGVAKTHTSPLKLNVVFHIPGNMLKPEFSGVRTGSYFKKLAALMVQVALPEELAEDVPAYIEHVTHLAIDEAARWAVKRRLEFDAALFHDIVERAGGSSSSNNAA